MKKIYKIFPIFFWLLIWWFVSIAINKEIYFPTPLTTFYSLKEIILKPKFILIILNTLKRVFLGFFIANIFGIVLGFLCGFKQKITKLIHPFMTTVRSTPVMGIIILAIIWFKSGNVPVFISFLMCFPIIWNNVYEGFKNLDKDLLEMAEIYKINFFKKIKNIYFPSIIPYYMAGFNLALGISWKVTVAAEVLSNPKFAIGTKLNDARVYLDTPSLFAWLIIIILLSYFIEILITNYLSQVLSKYY